MENPNIQAFETPVTDTALFDEGSSQTSEDRSLALIDDQGNVNTALLSQEEKERCEQLTRGIDVNDVNSVSNYGNEIQGAMNKYSSDFLTAVRAPKCGEMGTLITSLLSELDYIDTDELEPSSIKKFIRKIPILKSLVGSLEKVLKKYDSIDKNVTDISLKIKATSLKAMADNNALEVMFKNNLVYGEQAKQLVIAGKLKLEGLNRQIEEMRQHPDKYEAYEIQDMENFANNFEKKLYDLNALRYVVKMSLPQIRLVQNNNIAICQKANTIVSTTIPIWRQQLSLAVSLQNQQENILAQRKIAETTNVLIKRNAERLKQNSIEVAKENERGVIDVETLRESTNNLIETIREVKKIHEEATKNRKNAEMEMVRVETELNNAIKNTENPFSYLNAKS
jgi:uncharacterized protein YaaN involved in tellurite resistance